MKELTRRYELRDTHGDRPGVGDQEKLRDGGMAEEFAELFAIRDQATPDLGAENERGQETIKAAAQKREDRKRRATSEEYSKLNVRIPRTLHEELKSEASDAGVNLVDIVTPLLANRHDSPVDEPLTKIIEILTTERESSRFGVETLLEEILRRVLSTQLLAFHEMSKTMPPSDAEAYVQSMDETVRDLMSERRRGAGFEL